MASGLMADKDGKVLRDENDEPIWNRAQYIAELQEEYANAPTGSAKKMSLYKELMCEPEGLYDGYQSEPKLDCELNYQQETTEERIERCKGYPNTIITFSVSEYAHLYYKRTGKTYSVRYRRNAWDY